MFYDAIENRHGLKHNPWKSLVAPRPVGWISTVGRDGAVNLAPYSFFNACGEDPNYVMFASSGVKDSMRNVLDTGEFVCVMATWALREQMNVTSAGVGAGVDELKLAGLTPVPSRLVKPPRIAESPVAIECKFHQRVDLPSREDGRDDGKAVPYSVIFGLVVGIHIDDSVIRDGIVDIDAIQPIARLGYKDYAVVRADNRFSMDRPRVEDIMR